MVERLTSTKIADWLTTKYPLKFVTSPPITPESPAAIGIITMLAGQGFLDEKQFESRGFQLIIRGVQNNPLAVEDASMGIDTLLHTMDMPWKPGGALVRELTWMGGGPAPQQGMSFLMSYRYIWVCNYRTVSATGF